MDPLKTQENRLGVRGKCPPLQKSSCTILSLMKRNHLYSAPGPQSLIRNSWDQVTSRIHNFRIQEDNMAHILSITLTPSQIGAYTLIKHSITSVAKQKDTHTKHKK